MSTDTRTQAARDYDSQRDGTLYAKPDALSPLRQAAREMDRLGIPLDVIASFPLGAHGDDAILVWMQAQIALAQQQQPAA